MSRTVLFLGLACVASSVVSTASVASGQVIYEPVRYEYRAGSDYKFYYGGANPRVFDYAARVACLQNGRYGVREGRYGVGYIHRGLIGSPPYVVFNDCAPYLNAAVYGFTPADARNEAYARVPRYFTKAGLLASAVPVDPPEYYRKEGIEGVPAGRPAVLVVPAQGWPAAEPVPGIEIRPYRIDPATRPPIGPSTRPETRPAATPRPLMIIPKRLLERPKPTDKSVAAAR